MTSAAILQFTVPQTQFKFTKYVNVGNRVQFACSIKSEFLTTVTITEISGEGTASALKFHLASPSDISVYLYQTAQLYVPEQSDILSVLFKQVYEYIKIQNFGAMYIQ
jgi:hypothetical protein